MLRTTGIFSQYFGSVSNHPVQVDTLLIFVGSKVSVVFLVVLSVWFVIDLYRRRKWFVGRNGIGFQWNRVCRRRQCRKWSQQSSIPPSFCGWHGRWHTWDLGISYQGVGVWNVAAKQNDLGNGDCVDNKYTKHVSSSIATALRQLQCGRFRRKTHVSLSQSWGTAMCCLPPFAIYLSHRQVVLVVGTVPLSSSWNSKVLWESKACL